MKRGFDGGSREYGDGRRKRRTRMTCCENCIGCGAKIRQDEVRAQEEAIAHNS